MKRAWRHLVHNRDYWWNVLMSAWLGMGAATFVGMVTHLVCAYMAKFSWVVVFGLTMGFFLWELEKLQKPSGETRI